MSEHTKKRPTKASVDQGRKYTYCTTAAGDLLCVETKNIAGFLVDDPETLNGLCAAIAERYLQNKSWSHDDIFSDLTDKYGEQGSLLKGLRARENINQAEFAKRINITQPELSKLETGKRPIGKVVAQRIAKEFKIDYRVFL